MKQLRSFSIYTFVGFFGAGINFLLMPVLSHYLSPTDYGIIALINTYVTILLPLVGIEAKGYCTIQFFHMEDKSEFARLFSSVALIPVLPTLLLGTLFFFLFPVLAGPLELPKDAIWWGLSMFPLAIMSIYTDTASGYQIITKNANYYAVYVISKVLVEVGLTLLFVVHYGMGWQGRILSWIVTLVLYTIVAFIYFQREKLLSFRVNWKHAHAALLFGAPLIFHTLGKFVVNQSDRLFISKMVSLDEAGIYSVGYTIGTVMLIGATAFSNISSPFIMERLKTLTVHKEQQIRRFTLVGIAAMLGILILMNLASPFFFKYFMDPRYAEGAGYVFWVSLGYWFWGVYMLLSVYVYYYKKTQYLVWLAIVNILTNIGFNYLFIGWYGGIGAAYSTALSFLINLILMWFKVYNMLPWFRFRVSDFRLPGRG